MTNNIIKYTFWAALLIFITTSCNDFLDEVPDNRTNIGSDGKNIEELMVSAYPSTHYAVITELSSDNVDDCGAVYSEYASRFNEEAYKWSPITQPDNDGLEEVWGGGYLAIAASNEALQAISKADNPSSLDTQKGEALITRAYNHFSLANVFCMHYKKGSTDMGIPYMTIPETTVNPKYDRETIEETYKKINTDIETALPLIDDAAFKDKPIKYHFNKKAAYAFAARFNLFYENYDNVIEYANVVLGPNPEEMLRDWSYLASTSDRMIRGNRYSDAQEDANLLLLAVTTHAGLYYNEYFYGGRFTYNAGIEGAEINSEVGERGQAVPGPWKQSQILSSDAWSSTPKITVRKLAPYFEVKDPVSAIGLYKSVFPLFTAEEALLSRAEAYAMKGMYDKATEDIATFTKAFLVNAPAATRDEINDYFSSLEYYTPTKPTPKKELKPSFSIQSGEQENFIHCILLCRRMLSIHEGTRWFDVKRFGIEIYRRYYNEFTGVFTVLDTMKDNDKRRAIQLPQDVIASGSIAANPR